MAGGFMSSADPSSGPGASASGELRRRAQDSVRECVTTVAAHERGARGWVVPLAATAAVAAAAYPTGGVAVAGGGGGWWRCCGGGGGS
jgi:hypothetical protein